MPPRRLKAPVLAALAAFGMWSSGGTVASARSGPTRPNFLWITAEDICADLGCYGVPDAVTPNLDLFAATALRYTNVYSVHPCCSPSRSALATGVYPTRLGTFQHRGLVNVSPRLVKSFPALLREAGYYTFNGMKGGWAKLDYNFKPQDHPWDRTGSNRIEWRHRAPGQPFFGQVNIYCTHQSQYGHELTRKGDIPLPAWARVHDPQKIRVPPYQPDTPAARFIWRQYDDRVTQMDGEFAAILKLLNDDGLADDTIVIWCGDNGRGIPGGKIWLWDQGVHVPFMVHVPKKWAGLIQGDAAGVLDRMVSFVDFAPTILSLAGLPIPVDMQGRPFLGPAAGPPRDRVFAARDFHDNADFDTSRMVREGRWYYIRNFMPQIGWDPIQYAWEQAPGMLEEWRAQAARGTLRNATREAAFFRRSKPAEELYDMDADPDQMNNAAGDPKNQAILAHLRCACEAWMMETHDLGLLSQYELYLRSASDSPYAMATDPRRNPTAQLLAAADLANRRDPALVPELRELLHADDCAVRRWGAIGLLALGGHIGPARADLAGALMDESPDVRMTAAEALCGLGDAAAAAPVLIALLSHPSRIIRNETLLALCRIGPPARAALPHLDAATQPSPEHNGLWSTDNVPLEARLARSILDPGDGDPIRLTRERYLP